jgi:hypothetical protein
MNVSDVLSKGVSITGNEVYQNIDSVMIGYRNQIGLMWILIILLLVVFITGFCIWYFAYHRYKYKIYVKLPSGELLSKRYTEITDKVKFEHKKADNYFYIIDTECMILNGHYKSFFYFYRNPNPIKLDNLKHKVSTEIQNIDKVLEADTIQKFLLSGDIFNMLKILLIIILLVILGLAFADYMINSKLNDLTELVKILGGINGN